MVTPLRARRRGYTLIELIMVIAITGIFGVVVTIAAREVLDSETSKVADSNAQDLISKQLQFSQKYGSFTGFPEDIPAVGSYVIVTSTSRGPKEVSVALGVDGTLGVAAMRDGDTCVHYRVTALEAGGGSSRLSLGESAACRGEEALPSGEGTRDGADETSAAW
jgi:prepilin-type N-terminal cleavage/methylation domain-containing protein